MHTKGHTPRMSAWPLADIPRAPSDVHFRGKADMTFAASNVRFWHKADIA